MSGLSITFAQPCRTRLELAQRMRVTAALIQPDQVLELGVRASDLRLWAQAIEALEDQPAVVVSEVEREPGWAIWLMLAATVATAAMNVLMPGARFVAALLFGVVP